MSFRIACESNYVYRSMNLQMSYELHRLYTFNNSLWKPLSGSNSPSVLAHIGFYYSGNQAVIVCYKCLCNIDCSLSDSASLQHKLLSPRCLLVIGKATDNILLVDPEAVIKQFSSDAWLRDTTDRKSVQTVTVGPQSRMVEVSLFKTAYTIFVQAYSRCQKRGVFANADSEIPAIDRSNPDFDRLR